MDEFYHVPVMLDEVIESLHIQTERKYIDGTLGGGGHTREILNHGGVVLGIDQDEKAVESVIKNLKSSISENKLTVALGNFTDIKKIAEENGFERVDGILLDLGFSSFQVDKSGRGFSFLRDEPLDMRMGNGLLTAEEIVNTWSRDELNEIFLKYGEEHQAGRIAQEIVTKRQDKELKTSKDLADLIEHIIPRNGPIHPATRVFQALRIAVNDELEALKRGLRDGVEILKPGARFVIISFHSLEDRIVKTNFRDFEMKGYGIVITKKPLEATEKEVSINSRARSAKMRVFEKQ